MTSLRARASTTGGLLHTRVPYLAAAGLVLALAGPSAAQTYTVRPIAGLGHIYTKAHAINESGQVVGESTLATGPVHPFLWQDGVTVDLGTPAGPSGVGVADAIDNLGRVVGGYFSGGTWSAFLYQGGTMTTVTGLSEATGINDGGRIVGSCPTPTGSCMSAGGVVTDLGSLAGLGTTAMGIDNNNQVVGSSKLPSGVFHAFLWSADQMQDLGTLPGFTESLGVAISGTGVAVGSSFTPGGAGRAFRTSGAQLLSLGTLGGGNSEALGINGGNQIVGDSDVPAGGVHAFLIRDDSRAMIDLNTLVPGGSPLLTQAVAINDAGQIVIGGPTSYLLDPVQLNRFAYAWASNPSSPVGYTPDPGFAYSASGGAIVIARRGVGSYSVTFNALPASGLALASSVAVSAYGSSRITCAASGYSGSTTATAVAVTCTDTGTHGPADSQFGILVMGNRSLPDGSAFALTGGPAPVPPPSALTSWTSGGLPISATHNAALGDYNVLLGTGHTPLGAKLVTAAAAGVRCDEVQAVSGGLEVRCYDQTGAATDSRFSVLQVAGGRSGRRVGFALANLPTTASYTPAAGSAFSSSGGAITATRAATGQYAMTFAGLQKLAGHPEHVQVTAVSPSLRTCNVVGWGNAGAAMQVTVECRDGAGAFADAPYDVLVIE